MTLFFLSWSPPLTICSDTIEALRFPFSYA
jgi:hypothetical protein